MRWKFKFKCILVATGILVLIQFMNYEQIINALQGCRQRELQAPFLDRKQHYSDIPRANVPSNHTKLQLILKDKDESHIKAGENDHPPTAIGSKSSKPAHVIHKLKTNAAKYPNLRERYGVPHKSHPTVPRALTSEEYQTLMRLLKTVDGLFHKHNITYFMIYGTLIGSYMFHDIIPWDDDCDVLANNDSKALILDLFANGSSYAHEYGIRAFSPQQFLIKLFHVDSPAAGKHKKFPWNFPFIDIAFYTHKSAKVNILDKFHPMSVPATDVFPLHRRPFGDLWLPAPANTRKVLQAKLGPKPFVCATNGWNHRREDYYPGVQIDCDMLTEHYPIVHRTENIHGTNESLWLNGTCYYDVVVAETFHRSKSNFKEYFQD